MNVCNGAFHTGPCKKPIKESNTHALLSSAMVAFKRFPFVQLLFPFLLFCFVNQSRIEVIEENSSDAPQPNAKDMMKLMVTIHNQMAEINETLIFLFFFFPHSFRICFGFSFNYCIQATKQPSKHVQSTFVPFSDHVLTHIAFKV